MDSVTAVILAGGKSNRMGRDKLTLTLDGETFLQRAVRRFSAAFERVTVSVADLGKFPEYGERRVPDLHPGLGPISGLHASLSASADGVFLTAADMPYANPLAAMRIIELGQDFDACVIRYLDGRAEPLFAYYSTAVLPECERVIASGRYNIAQVFEGVNTRYIAPGELGGPWDDNLPLNVNNPGDYEKIQKLGPRA